MPKDKKAIPRKKGKFGNLPLPVDLIEELRGWKLSYELAWSNPAPDGEQYRMTMEQLIRRLLEGVKRLDPEVWAVHESGEKSREEQRRMMADFRKNFWGELFATKTKLDGLFEGMINEIAADGDSPAAGQEQVKGKEVPAMNPDGTFQVDPTEREVWDLQYFFTNDEGEELEAFVGDKAAFYCNLNGRSTGMAMMMKNGWKLMNDAGVELTKEQAVKISQIIKQHRAQHDKEDNQA